MLDTVNQTTLHTLSYMYILNSISRRAKFLALPQFPKIHRFYLYFLTKGGLLKMPRVLGKPSYRHFRKCLLISSLEHRNRHTYFKISR